jgi:hypothetical protein
MDGYKPFCARVLTYKEYRAVSGVFRTKLLNPPPPPPFFQPASESSARTKGGGVHARRAVRGWGINKSEDTRHRIGHLQYNPSSLPPFPFTPGSPLPKAAVWHCHIIAAAAALCDFQPFADFHTSLAFPHQFFPPAIMVFSL